MRRALIFILAWFAVAFTLSSTGWFQRFTAPALFGIGSIASSTGFLILHALSENFRGFVRARNLRRLTYGQLLRLFGILALVKADQKILAPAFAIPTGIMDIVIALGAVFAASRLVTDKGHAKTGFVVFHILGLATLGISAILALLTYSIQYGLADDGVTSRPMNHFPMSLVPTFIGPLMVILHFQALAVACRFGEKRAHPSG